jgi:cation transport ATPase
MNSQPYPPDPNYREGYPVAPNDDTVQSVSSDAVHAHREHERYVDPAGNQVEQREEVVENKNVSRANNLYWVTTVTYFVLGVLEVILFLRFIFRLLGANEGNAFITFLYSLSLVFVGAFNGIFNDQALGHSVFELSTLTAMLIYALIAWGIVSLGRLVFVPRATGYRNTFTTRRSRPT